MMVVPSRIISGGLVLGALANFSAVAIAQGCMAIAGSMALDPEVGGIFHFSSAPAVSWFDFAEEIFSASGVEVELTPIETNAYPTRVRRPRYSVLDCQSTCDTFAVSQPNWREDLLSVLRELGEVK